MWLVWVALAFYAGVILGFFLFALCAISGDDTPKR